VQLVPGELGQVTIVFAPSPDGTPQPAGTPVAVVGVLVIVTVDAADGTTVLAGACYVVTAADGTIVETCDDDGDGAVRFDGLAPGDYLIRETIAPEGYAPGPEQAVVIPEGAEINVVVANEAIAARLPSG
jgi:uncharacterized surface anchored protein